MHFSLFMRYLLDSNSQMSKVKLKNSGRVYEIMGDQSILDAALDAGLILEHGCKTGRCGSCKSRMVSGKTKLIHEELCLSKAELDDGWFLSCARTPIDGDIEIIAEDLSEYPIQKPQTFPCKINDLTYLSDDVLRVSLRLPPGRKLSYRAGQHVDITAAGGLTRSYSLARGYSSGSVLELHIRKVDAGLMSNYWFKEAKKDDLLRIYGPKGTFFLRDADDLDLIFLATGTGIAPIRAILEDLAESDALKPRSVSIYWGGRLVRDLYLEKSELAGYGKYYPTLSKEGVSWEGHREYVQNLALMHEITVSRARVYACGSSTMITDAQLRFAEIGLKPEHFIFDAFVPSS